MNQHLVISPETVYVADEARGLMVAAHEADRAGYQMVVYQHMIYVVLRVANDLGLYTAKCEIDDPEYITELVSEFNQLHGTGEQA